MKQVKRILKHGNIWLSEHLSIDYAYQSSNKTFLRLANLGECELGIKLISKSSFLVDWSKFYRDYNEES